MRDYSETQRLQVTEASQLLNFLQEQRVRKSRNAIKQIIEQGLVKVNGRRASLFAQPLVEGDLVTLHKATQSEPRRRELSRLKIVYEDDFLLVIDKEAGLLSIASEGEKRETAYSMLSDYLKASKPGSRVFVVHRLDRETSGLMMFAKSVDVQGRLQSNWDEAVQRREYLAVVEGRFTPEKGRLVSWLTEDKFYKMHASARDNGGQKAITYYETMRYNKEFSLLLLNLETGRKNQLRVQLQQAGHPIVGDKKYGSRYNPIQRVALHACSLDFVHPITGVLLQFNSDIPQKMKTLLRK
jgi:pseudouridine synthase, RluA family